MKIKTPLALLVLFIITIPFTYLGCNSSDPFTFPQPPSLSSVQGLLQTTLRVLLSENSLIDPQTGEVSNLETPTYNAGLIGPTFRIMPGDTLKIDLDNQLPPNPQQDRMGAFPHNPFTTNFHTHGLTVDPGGIADNVFRQMDPGTVSPIEIQVPEFHHAGTFWYHPHKHGSVSFQFFGGMTGFLIIEGGPSDLNQVPEIAIAQEVLMGLQVIRTDANGKTPYVNLEASQASSDPGMTNGLWATYQNSMAFFTNNGVLNPTLTIRPGEVQRWRILNAASGETLAVALQGHAFQVVALDGINLSNAKNLAVEEAVVMGAGNRLDIMVKAGAPGTYLLQALDPTTPRSVSLENIAPASRNSRIGGDFPMVNWPVTLATVVVEGDPLEMNLPSGPLPYPEDLFTKEELIKATPDQVRRVAFEACGQGGLQMDPANRLDSCGWYFQLYDDDYWGGAPFTNLLMMRDADDVGVPSNPPDPNMPRVDYQKEGLFDADAPLFSDMVEGNIEEWTIINRSFSDHPFHIHTNPFLLTHVNGIPLAEPEWRDVVLVPAAQPEPTMAMALPINDPGVTFGSVTFRTHLEPGFTGNMVMHCHILTHEDIGMMQRLQILPFQ